MECLTGTRAGMLVSVSDEEILQLLLVKGLSDAAMEPAEDRMRGETALPREDLASQF